MDITGGVIDKAYQLVQEFARTRKKQEATVLQSPGFVPDFTPGYVVSLNIMNQLDILIVDYLKKFSIYDAEEIMLIRKMIQKAHIDSLPENNSCLITDYEELIYDDGTLERINPLVHVPLPEGKQKANWEWLFDSQKTYYHGKTTKFHVAAIEL